MRDVNESPAVAEVQGLYGPFSFTEKALQKIWLHGEFDRSAARLADGRSLRVLHPGKWNLLGGPDFTGARIALGAAAETVGDVELHLRAGDWLTHRHAEDPAYDHVGLHVVLFPPEPGYVTRGRDGREIPLLVLLALLPHDLEEFAADEAVEALAGLSGGNAPEELALLEQPKLLALMRSHAAARWSRKVDYARRRIDRLGWDDACHHAALETLGYRFNRPPMLRLAERWPLQDWAAGAVDADGAFAREVGTWSVQGVRPANHPRVRLQQYVGWTRVVPEWPERFAGIARKLPADLAEGSTREIRRRHRFAVLREQINADVCGGALGGTRLDNFICDALLPLHEARVGGSRVFGLWFNWFSGDQPPAISRVLGQLGVCDGRDQPMCHGFAQGLLGWFIAHDAQRSSPEGRGA